MCITLASLPPHSKHGVLLATPWEACIEEACLLESCLDEACFLEACLEGAFLEEACLEEDCLQEALWPPRRGITSRRLAPPQ